MTYTEAWAPTPPSGEVWTARPWVHPNARVEQGQLVRNRVPRTSHAAFAPRVGRDPIAILARQEEDRLQDLVPLRHSRTAESPFASRARPSLHTPTVACPQGGRRPTGILNLAVEELTGLNDRALTDFAAGRPVARAAICFPSRPSESRRPSRLGPYWAFSRGVSVVLRASVILIGQLRPSLTLLG
jgi:hypothetical protein